jgi:glycosyltransferase involved in cell wall biosynthesis
MIRVWWITPERAGGIRTYAEALFPFLSDENTEARATWVLPDSTALEGSREEVIHLQHEFGLFGSKLPWSYSFPEWLAFARKHSPGRTWVATAHTVIDRDWKYPTAGRGWRALPYLLANCLVVPFARRAWMNDTWSGFDAVIVHSELQAEVIRRSGCLRVATIPHFVRKVTDAPPRKSGTPTAVLFGYFSYEKGQDLAIRAWAEWGSDAPKLILAGGLRRKEDRWYLDRCQNLIRKHGLEDKIEITGYVPNERVEEIYAQADIVIAPFRETNGSGSLATAFSYHSAILASDLPLNLEVAKRVPGCAAFFEAGSAKSLAREARALFANANKLQSLRAGARRYAEYHSLEETLRLHREFYAKIRGESKRGVLP